LLEAILGSSTKENPMSKKSTNTDIVAQQFANSTVQQLDALYKTRENWEATDFKKANEGLYSLLSKCLAVFNDEYVKADKDAQKALRSVLTNKLTAAGVKVQSNTSTIKMFVRFVFNADRKRAQGYATVLTKAINEGIDAKDLTAHIVAAGGIEEIKRSTLKSDEAIANKTKLDAAMADVAHELEIAAIASPLATVEIEGLSGSYALLLVKPKLGGTADVVGSLSDLPDTLVQALIARMAKVRVQEVRKAEATAKADQDILAKSLSASNDAQMKKAA
jgi:hypothetical protein